MKILKFLRSKNWLKSLTAEELKMSTTRCPTKTLGHDRRGGFTLVELVIVIAIVIILSVVSVPIYRGYTKSAKMSEAYALLGLILSSQKAYYSQYGNFLTWHSTETWTAYEPVLGIDARGNKYFTRFSPNWQDSPNSLMAYVVKPKDLRIEESKSLIRLIYSVKSGSTIKDDIEINN